MSSTAAFLASFVSILLGAALGMAPEANAAGRAARRRIQAGDPSHPFHALMHMSNHHAQVVLPKIE